MDNMHEVALSHWVGMSSWYLYNTINCSERCWVGVSVCLDEWVMRGRSETWPTKRCRTEELTTSADADPLVCSALIGGRSTVGVRRADGIVYVSAPVFVPVCSSVCLPLRPSRRLSSSGR